jgi:hypothetical protein
MDGGSGLNILYAETYDTMGLARSRNRPTGTLFHGVVLGVQAIPLRQIDFPFTFGRSANFRTKTLTFEVIDFAGSYHAILGWPYYAKFMAVPNYTYLKLKIPGPKGVVMVGGSLQQANLCKKESYNLGMVAVRSFELRSIQLATAEAMPNSVKGKSSAGAFKHAEDTKPV